MKKRRILTLGLCLLMLTGLRMLTGCSGDSTAVPQTEEEVDTFDEVLAFISGQTDVEVTDVQVLLESDAEPTEPVSLSKEDSGALLALMETTPFVLEEYEPEPLYGVMWHYILCTLENGETVMIYPAHDALSFTRTEQNEEGKWQKVSYRLLYENPDVSREIFSSVLHHWNDIYSIPEGETRTVAQILGDEVFDARQIILRMSLDGNYDTEIRLYIDTEAHPELLDVLTGLKLDQKDVERGRNPYMTIGFHIGEEDYRYGDHILPNSFTVYGECLDIAGNIMDDYRMYPVDNGFFTDWLVEWVYAHRDDDGVKIVRWDVE